MRCRTASPGPRRSRCTPTRSRQHYSVTVALHTDHCPAENLDDWVRPLIADAIERRRRGLDPLYQSHMWDGSAVPLDENLRIARRIAGVVGAGEHDSRDRGRCDRRRGGRRVPRDQRTAVLHRRRRARHHRRAGGGGARSIPDRVDLRQRARCLPPGFGPSAPGDPRGDPDRHRRRNRTGQAVRPRLPRRIGIERRGHRVRRRERGREDERRHRHPVRVHPVHRRPHDLPSTTRCSRSTAATATRRPTTRGRGASRPRVPWPQGLSRRPRCWVRPDGQCARCPWKWPLPRSHRRW